MPTQTTTVTEEQTTYAGMTTEGCFVCGAPVGDPHSPSCEYYKESPPPLESMGDGQVNTDAAAAAPAPAETPVCSACSGQGFYIQRDDDDERPYLEPCYTCNVADNDSVDDYARAYIKSLIDSRQRLLSYVNMLANKTSAKDIERYASTVKSMAKAALDEAEKARQQALRNA